MKTAHKLYNYVVYMRVKKLIYTTCSSILSKYEIPILIIIIPKIRPFSSTRFHIMAVFLAVHSISRRRTNKNCHAIESAGLVQDS